MSSEDQFQVGKEIGDVADETLRFLAQIGVETIGMPTRLRMKAGTNPTKRPLVPPAQLQPLGKPNLWDETELREIKAKIENSGMEVATASLPLSGNIVMGSDGRTADLEIVKANIKTAGRVGIPVLTYNFTALRASEGYAARYRGGRGGADLRDFNYARIRGLPPLDAVGEHGHDQMWERISVFLHAVVPAAEAAGVRLAVHPNDPPVPTYRGVAQPLSDLNGLKRLVDLIDSPSNSIFFDTGVTTEMGEDAPTALRLFGKRKRIAAVHFRNVRVEVPRDRYVETFHDDGDCDMAGCLKTLQSVNYGGVVYPDHTPYITNDTHDTRIGWAFAIGQIIGLRSAIA